MSKLFPSSSMGPLYLLSQLGLVLFMFLVGLEMRPSLIRRSARSVIVASQASMLAPFACGGILALRLYGRLGEGVAKLPFVLFFGAAMSIAAFPVLARILADRKLMNTRAGMLSLSCAAVGDVSAWCLLAVITVVARPEAGQTVLPLRFATLGIYILAMLFLLRPVLRRLLPISEPPGPGRFAAIMIMLLMSVWTTEALAVHALSARFWPVW